MLRVGRTPAVAECQQLPAGGQGAAHDSCGGHDRLHTVAGEALMRRNRLIENRAHDVYRVLLIA